MTLEGLLALLILSQDMWCPPLSFLFCFRSHFYPVKQSFKQQWNAASTPRHKLHLVQSSGRTVPGTVDRNLPPCTWIQTDSNYMINAVAWLNQQDTVDVCQGRTAICPLDEPSLSACGPAAALTRPLREVREQGEEEVSWRTAASPASSNQIRAFW